MKENRKLLKEVLKDIRHDMTDDEVLNLLADSKISVNPESAKEKYTLGQRAADTIAKFAGSWAFIFCFTGILILWMVINTVLASKAFDPYPFILLNLVLSCVAVIQAPLIMMSQNRQEEKDRRRAENDYKVNLKTEIIIEDLYDKVNAILAKQSILEKHLQIKLPIILDSPRGKEVDQENIDLMMNILKRDFSENQIIIASIYCYSFPEIHEIELKENLIDQLVVNKEDI